MSQNFLSSPVYTSPYGGNQFPAISSIITSPIGSIVPTNSVASPFSNLLPVVSSPVNQRRSAQRQGAGTMLYNPSIVPAPNMNVFAGMPPLPRITSPVRTSHASSLGHGLTQSTGVTPGRVYGSSMAKHTGPTHSSLVSHNLSNTTVLSPSAPRASHMTAGVQQTHRSIGSHEVDFGTTVIPSSITSVVSKSGPRQTHQSSIGHTTSFDTTVIPLMPSGSPNVVHNVYNPAVVSSSTVYHPNTVTTMARSTLPLPTHVIGPAVQTHRSSVRHPFAVQTRATSSPVSESHSFTSPYQTHQSNISHLSRVNTYSTTRRPTLAAASASPYESSRSNLIHSSNVRTAHSVDPSRVSKERTTRSNNYYTTNQLRKFAQAYCSSAAGSKDVLCTRIRNEMGLPNYVN